MDLSGTPHVVSVQLVRASELVAVGLGIHAAQKSVTCLKAQLFVPGLLRALASRKYSVFKEAHCILSFANGIK